MVFGRVERGEIEPVGLNFGTFGNIKPHRSEELLDPLKRQGYGVKSTLHTVTTWQGDIQRFCLQLLLQFGFRKFVAARLQGSFHRLFGDVDGGATCLFLFDVQRRQPSY